MRVEIDSEKHFRYMSFEGNILETEIPATLISDDQDFLL